MDDGGGGGGEETRPAMPYIKIYFKNLCGWNAMVGKWVGTDQSNKVEYPKVIRYIQKFS